MSDNSAGLPAEETTAVIGPGKYTVESRLLGAHMPTSGGLHKSLLLGKEIGCTAIQLFTGSPRQWNHPPLDESAVRKFLEARQQTGITCAVAHDSYLINLAAPDPDLLERSRKAFRKELDRAERLQLSWVVTHMGAHIDGNEEAAQQRLIESLKMLLEETDAAGYQVGIALETTAGQGTGLGWQFEQIGHVLQGVGAHPRLGVCLDTCHIFVAGYDIREEAVLAAMWQQFDKAIGLENLKVLHLNDAKKPLGSRVDRHEHIGEGSIGAEAFRRIISDPKLFHVPVILETPESETMHPVNLKRLRRLAGGGKLQISVQVQLYGRLTEVAKDPFTIELRDVSTVCDLVTELAGRDTRLGEVAEVCRYSVNEELCEVSRPLSEGDLVCILPPVSGG